MATAKLIRIRLYQGSAVSGNLSPSSGPESGISSSSIITSSLGAGDGVGVGVAEPSGVPWFVPPIGTGSSVTVTTAVPGEAVTAGDPVGAADVPGVAVMPGMLSARC